MYTKMVYLCFELFVKYSYVAASWVILSERDRAWFEYQIVCVYLATTISCKWLVMIKVIACTLYISFKVVKNKKEKECGKVFF